MKWLALGLWLALIAVLWWYGESRDLGPLRLVERLIQLMGGQPLGFALFLGAFAIRPLLLFPVTLLVLAAGFIFGPALGLVIGFVGSLGSAIIAYGLARLFAGEPPEAASQDGASRRFLQRLRHNSFETVLVSRLIFLPGDLVSYLAGFFKINPAAFALATALGGMPALAASVLFGASFEGEFGAGRPDIDWWLLLASGGMLLVSLSASFYLRRHKGKQLVVQPQPTRLNG